MSHLGSHRSTLSSENSNALLKPPSTRLVSCWVLNWCKGSSWIRQQKLRQKLNFWRVPAPPPPINSERKELFSPLWKCCGYIVVNYPFAFAVSAATRKAGLRQFKGHCNPVLLRKEGGVPSAYDLSMMDTTVHHSCPPLLPGFFPCPGTADALESPFLKKL